MFQNVLMTVTPLSEIKNEDKACWENRPFMYSWPEPHQQKIKKETITRTIKKKNKRNRTAYTTDQLRVLEKTFASTKYVDADRRKALADLLNIGEKCVKVWFQNRRMKEKKESTELSNDSSSECVAYEPITPPPANPDQNITKHEYFLPNKSNMEPKVLCNNSTEPQPSYYPRAEDCKHFHPAYGYQNYVPMDYATYGMSSYGNEYFSSDTAMYSSQYYPYPAAPDCMYTNMDGNACLENQQHTFSDFPYWSTSGLDMNYF